MPAQHDAFISYSHAADAALATTLESALERLAKPTFRLRAMDVFRDQTSLSASPALWSGIVNHLSGSRWLVLLTSAASAASPWCTREVEWWLKNRGASTVLLVVTDGDMVWDGTAGDFDWSRTTVLPSVLRGQFAEEPFYADLRWARGEPALSLRHTRFRSVVLDLAATIRGIPKDVLDGDDVRQAKRTKRLAQGAVAAIATVATIAVWQAIEATSQRRVAERERDRAISRMLAGQATDLRTLDPRLSLLLAAQALAASESTEAATSLLRVLQAAPFDRIIEHASDVWSLDVSGDETWIALADGRGGTVRADLSSGDVRDVIGPRPDSKEFPASAASLAVAVSPDGRWIAAGGFDQTVTVWHDGAIARRIASGPDAHEGFILGLAFSPDARVLASAGSDGRILVHHLDTGAVEKLKTGSTPEMSRVRFSPDGTILAAGGDAATVLLFPRAHASRAAALKPVAASSVEAFAFARDGTELFAAFFDRAVGDYDVRSGELRTRIDAAQYAYITALAATPDGTRLFTGHDDGAVISWTRDSSQGWQSTALYRHSSKVTGAAFLQRSKRLTTVAFDGRLFVTRGSPLPRFTRELWRASVPFRNARLLGDHATVSLDNDGRWTTVDLRTGRVVPDAAAEGAVGSDANAVIHARDGRGRRLTSEGGHLVVRDHVAGTVVPLVALRGHVDAAVFGADRRAVYVLLDNRVTAWNPATGATLATSDRLPQGLFSRIAVSADGSLVAVARSPSLDLIGAAGRRAQSQHVALLRAQDLTSVAATLESIPQQSDVSSFGGEPLFFTPDRALLGLTTGDRVTLWDLASLQRLDESLSVPSAAIALGFDREPRTLLVAVPGTQTVDAVDLRYRTWADEACRLASRSLTRDEWARYVSRTMPYAPACVDGTFVTR